MTFRLESRILNDQRKTSRVLMPTHILYEAMDDLENFRCGRPSLILGEAI